MLVETGDSHTKAQTEFLSLLKKVIQDGHFEISDVLITHAHSDHFGGLQPVLDMLA